MNEAKMKVYRITREDGSKVPMPKYGTGGSAGFDFFSFNESDIHIQPNENVKIPLGVKLEIPVGYQMLLFNRSGMATNENCVLTTGTSVIDSDFRDELQAPIKNHGNEVLIIKPFTKLCQGELQKIDKAQIQEVESEDDLNTPEEAHLGFGSTGSTFASEEEENGEEC